MSSGMKEKHRASHMDMQSLATGRLSEIPPVPSTLFSGAAGTNHELQQLPSLGYSATTGRGAATAGTNSECDSSPTQHN